MGCNRGATIPNLFSLLDSTYIELKASSTSLPPLTQSSRPRLRLKLKACLRRVAGVWLWSVAWKLTNAGTHSHWCSHSCVSETCSPKWALLCLENSPVTIIPVNWSIVFVGVTPKENWQYHNDVVFISCLYVYDLSLYIWSGKSLEALINHFYWCWKVFSDSSFGYRKYHFCSPLKITKNVHFWQFGG